MDKETILKKTEKFAKDTMQNQEGGHDWWHVYRVCNIAEHIAKKEKADLYVVKLAAYLHDIKDWKFADRDDEGVEAADKWLKSIGADKYVIEHVCRIIKTLSFKGLGVETPMDTLEGKIVQDADRLDALGAIGIMRAASYGGCKGRELYNPDIKPAVHNSFKEYKASKSTTINHFYEKLLHLKDRMNTATARRIAEPRHDYMVRFLDQFLDEWAMKK